MWHIDDLRGQLGGSKWVRFTISFLCPGGSFYELKPRLTRGEGGRRVAGKEKFLQNEEQKSEWERGAEIRIRTRSRNLNQNQNEEQKEEGQEGLLWKNGIRDACSTADILGYFPLLSSILSIFIYFHSFWSILSTSIHFHPLWSTFIHLHPLSSIFIHFHPLSSIVSTFIQFHPF